MFFLVFPLCASAELSIYIQLQKPMDIHALAKATLCDMGMSRQLHSSLSFTVHTAALGKTVGNGGLLFR